nr:hypothetical protein CFP56_60460 [Quercus suber]
MSLISVLAHSQKTMMPLPSSVMKLRNLLLDMGLILKWILRISTCNESSGIIVLLDSFWTTESFQFTIYNRLSTLHGGLEMVRFWFWRNGGLTGPKSLTAQLCFFVGSVTWTTSRVPISKFGIVNGSNYGHLGKMDWEDYIPRNIRFLRVRVRVDPWMPSTAGFMLRLDDGTQTWVQRRYERVGENGPFMTNGTLRENSRSNSNIDSDETILLFNLDRLNEDCPDWVHRDAWSPPSPASVASDLGQTLNLQCGEDLDSSQVPTKKRSRKEFGRLERNIRQKLLCGFFSMEGTIFATFEPPSYTIDYACHINEEAPFYPKGCWEVDPNQLPQQP